MKKEIKETKSYFINRTKNYCKESCSYLKKGLSECTYFKVYLKHDDTQLGLGEYERLYIPCKECNELFKDELKRNYK